VTHPLFEYRVSYRRLVGVQVRLLVRVIEGEISEYPVFVTRKRPRATMRCEKAGDARARYIIRACSHY
jgi:hypothetical protein